MLALTHLVYLASSIGIAVWVGQTLHKRGHLFLLDAFDGDDALADSVNHLLVVGFYLVNMGFVGVSIRMGLAPHDVASAVEVTSVKVGTVLLVLGAMHFFNLYVLSRIRRRAQIHKVPPPVAPTTYIRPNHAPDPYQWQAP